MFVDDHAGREVAEIPTIPTHDLMDDDEVVIAIGDPRTRKAVDERIRGTPAELISQSTIIGPDIEYGEGAVFCPFTMLTASIRVGRHFQCNIYSYVAHDCVIGDYVTFAPKVCCNGNVRIEDGAYIGTGAVLRQGTADQPLIIGRNAVVGMGAVVTKNVPPDTTVVGNPAKPLARS